ncbi:GTPase [Synechococcus sp. Tobar12-5m-g]|nr:GTPase [Synechococcus sp. Tobar12-5m-g]
MDELQAFLLARPEPAIQQQAAELKQQRESIAGRSLLSLSFSGQFSAGKSTIISALTGNREIKISADVTTDSVTAYAWSGVELWDTPGLYANRIDHDEKAQKALRESDLVVYCLTTNLFDEVTARDFRQLAFEQGFAGKIFLVINKLSMEDVEYMDKYISNLTESINRTLSPHQLNKFPHAFIDAQDYRDGIATGNEQLVSFSRFPGFIDGLNSWVQSQGLLARLDPPIRLGLNAIDQSLASLPEPTFGDDPKLFLLNQQHRIVLNQRSRTAAEVKQIGTSCIQQLLELGEKLIEGELGSEEQANKQAFDQRWEAINAAAYTELNATLQRDYQIIEAKLEEFAKENFVADYYAKVEASLTESAPRDGAPPQRGVGGLKETFKKLLDQGRDAVLKPGATQSKMLYDAKEVAGGSLHKVIYEGGKLLGFKFKPWGAVNAVKGAGNLMIGLSIAISAFEVYDVINQGVEAEKRDRQREKELLVFRSALQQSAEATAARLFEVYQSQYDLEIIEKIASALTRARDEILAHQASTKSLVEGLAAHRKQLMALLAELYPTAV